MVEGPEAASSHREVANRSSPLTRSAGKIWLRVNSARPPYPVTAAPASSMLECGGSGCGESVMVSWCMSPLGP